MSSSLLSIFISIISLVISVVTAWFSLRRGTIKMTRPTTIYFGPDTRNCRANPKVYLRTLLFSTSKRGQIVESMHVQLSRNETVQTFNIWVYGEDKKVRGSGLFVGETGIATSHHFLLPKDVESHFRFSPGTYRLNVFVKLLGHSRGKKLFSEKLEVSQEDAKKMLEMDRGLYFDWGPDSLRYLASVDIGEIPSQIPPSAGLLNAFLSMAENGKSPSDTDSSTLR